MPDTQVGLAQHPRHGFAHQRIIWTPWGVCYCLLCPLSHPSSMLRSGPLEIVWLSTPGLVKPAATKISLLSTGWVPACLKDPGKSRLPLGFGISAARAAVSVWWLPLAVPGSFGMPRAPGLSWAPAVVGRVDPDGPRRCPERSASPDMGRLL